MRTALLLTGLLLAFGCGRDKPTRSTAKPVSEPVAATPPAPAPAPAPAAGGDISGTVVETMDASAYTYALLEKDGTKVWVAGPQTKLAVGTAVGPVKGTPMPGFHSDTLKRTFELIYFIDAFPVAAAAANPHASPQVAAAIEKIEPVRGGTTVGKIFEDKATLAGKAVIVRGKVIKVNNGILGRNWVHLQDGTGAAGTNDLMVTTNATATVGDVVVVRGKVAIDQDFGGGYRYAVLVEDATLAAK